MSGGGRTGKMLEGRLVVARERGGLKKHFPPTSLLLGGSMLRFYSNSNLDKLATAALPSPSKQRPTPVTQHPIPHLQTISPSSRLLLLEQKRKSSAYRRRELSTSFARVRSPAPKDHPCAFQPRQRFTSAPATRPARDRSLIGLSLFSHHLTLRGRHQTRNSQQEEAGELKVGQIQQRM